VARHDGPLDVGVHLTTVGSKAEADVICGLLRAAGIKCGDREATGVFVGSFADGFWYEVLVRDADLDAAIKLLDQAAPLKRHS
jgi:Putative prokaryotic signal transducing protein